MESAEAYQQLSEVTAGFPLEVHPRVHSTQVLALERLPAAFQVIAAVEQTRGQGRHGRVWGSPPGGLWFSLILPITNPEGLSLLAGLAVARRVAALGLDPWLRWPNDVMVGTSKLAGVLVDVRWSGGQGTAVVGIGLNVDPSQRTPEMEGVATTLVEQGVPSPHLGRLLLSIVRELRGLCEGGLTAAHAELTRLVVGPGRDVEIQQEGQTHRDRITGLASDGALILQERGTLYAVERLVVLRPAASHE